MAGYYAMLQQAPAAAASVQSGLGDIARAVAQAKQRRDAKAEHNDRLRWEREQAFAEREADRSAAEIKERDAGRTSSANRERYFAQLLQARPQDADQISQAARAQGVDIGSIVTPETMQQAQGVGIEIEDAVTPEQAAMTLGGRASSVLGAPAQQKDSERMTPDIIEFERARPDLVGSQQYGPELEKWIRYRAASKSGGEDPSMKLRKEFQSLPVVKDTEQMATAYGKIMQASDTGPGDMGLVFGFMKMLDPNSSVREGEYANAENAGGVSTKVRMLYNKALDGQFLTPQLRSQFKGEAGRLFEAQRRQYDAKATEYKRLAGDSAGDVVLPINSPVAARQPTDDEIDAAIAGGQ